MLAAWEALPRTPTSTAGLLLLRLAWRADEKGVCWPGKHTLAQEMGLSKRTVDAAIMGLAKGGFIKVKPRKNMQGRDLAPLYVLPIMPHPPKTKEQPAFADAMTPMEEDADFAWEDAEIAPENSSGKSSFFLISDIPQPV